MYLSSKEVTKKLNVSDQTLRDWANLGKIKYIKTKGGHRRYLLEEETQTNPNRLKVIYARVSSKKQEGDLERQIQFLKEKYPDHQVISDIGSGINFKRSGFRKVLECLFAGNLEECIVSAKDRFARCGDLFEWIFTKFNSKLISLQEQDETTEEFTDELMEIITVFAARYYGKRSYSNNKKNKNIPDDGAEEIV